MNMEYPLSNRPSPAPLRLLEVLEPSGGGSGRHFIDLCRGMHLRGHHVEAVYSPVRAEEGFIRELRAVGLPAVHAVNMKRAPGPSDIPAFLALRRIMRHHGPFDIIHGHSSKAGALTRLRLPGRHVPRIYTPHAFRTLDPTLGAAAGWFTARSNGVLPGSIPITSSAFPTTSFPTPGRCICRTSGCR